MIRRFLSVLLLLPSLSLAQAPARVTFTASNVLDSGGSAPLASGKLCFLTTDANDKPMGYRVGASSGQTSASPDQAPCAPVTAGAITPIQIINSGASSPLNACIRVVTKDASGTEIRRNKCVQTGTDDALASWCDSSGGNISCNWDRHPIGTLPVPQVTVGPPGPQGASGCLSSASSPCTGTVVTNPAGNQAVAQPDGTNLAINHLSADPYNIQPDNQTFYFDGSSIGCGYLTSSTVLPGGCFQGAAGAVFVQMSPFVGHSATYYNDSIPGGTTPDALTRYTAGNSNYGVVVPSAHSVSPAVTCPTFNTNRSACPRKFFLYEMGTAINDANHNVSVSTAVTALRTLLSNAHTDGYKVILITNISTLPAPYNTVIDNIVDAAFHDSSIYWDQLWDVRQTLPNLCDANDYNTDCVHPTAAGDKKVAAVYLSCFLAGGCASNMSNSDVGLRYQVATTTGAVYPGTKTLFAACPSDCTLTLPLVMSNSSTISITNAFDTTVTLNTAGNWKFNLPGLGSSFPTSMTVPPRSSVTLHSYFDGNVYNWFVDAPVLHGVFQTNGVSNTPTHLVTGSVIMNSPVSQINLVGRAQFADNTYVCTGNSLGAQTGVVTFSGLLGTDSGTHFFVNLTNGGSGDVVTYICSGGDRTF